MNPAMFRNLHPNIQAYVNCVLKNKFGIELLPATVAVRPSYGQINRIAVSVPYCRDNLTWEFSFRLDDLYSPPDVIAMDTAVEAIKMNCIPKLIPSLADWCPDKENCLLNLIRQLIQLHFFSQEQRLLGNEEINRLRFEFEAITEMRIVPLEKLELTVTYAHRAISVNFHFPIRLDLTELPVEFSDESDVVFLTISYRIPGQTKIDLKVSSVLRELIGVVDLPMLSADSSLIEFVPFVQNKMAFMVGECRYSYAMKQQFFAAIASRLGTSVLNADSENFSKISFLLTRGNRKVVFVINIPFRFPKEKPIVKLLVEELNPSNTTPRELKFPFDQKWTADKMALEMLKSVTSGKMR